MNTNATPEIEYQVISQYERETNPVYWLAIEHHRTEKNQTIRFSNHQYMLDIYKDKSEYLVIRKSTQCGASLFMMCRTMSECLSGRSIFYIMPTLALVGRYVKNRVDRTIDYTPYYNQRIKLQDGTKPAKSMSLKHLGNGSIAFVGSNASSAFTEFPADSLFVDELDSCFCPNTMITTEYGYIPISVIVNNKMKIRIWTYNFKNKRYELKKIKRYIKIKQKNKMVMFGNLKATKDHKIFIKDKGFISINNILTSLHDIDKEVRYYVKKMQIVRGRTKITGNNILQSIMCYNMANATAGAKENKIGKTKIKIFGSIEKIMGNKLNYWKKKLYGKKKNGYFKKDKGSKALAIGWEWSSDELEARKACECSWLEKRICSYYRKQNNPPCLQNRCCKSRKENSHRSGECCKSIKDTVVREKWVDLYTFFKQNGGTMDGGMSSDGYVYNLEIEINHNYFANDILVANCCQENLPMAEERLSASKNPSRIKIGNPTIGNYGIDYEYSKTDKKTWHIKCSSCGEWLTPDFFVHVVKHIGGNDYILLDTEYDFKHERDIHCICHKCGKPFERFVRGEWVAEYPDVRRSGYYISKMFSTQMKIQDIVSRFQDGLTDDSKMQRFYNGDLGLPYTSQGSKITTNMLNACVKDYALQDGCADRCIMGIDVGKKMHVVIAKASDPVQVVYIGTVVNEDDLYDLYKRFNVLAGVIDAMPEERLSRRVTTLPGMFRCFFGKTQTDKMNVADRTISVSRTASLDAVKESILTGKIILPRNASKIEPLGQNGQSEFYNNICSSTRVFNEQRQEYVWVESEPDHYFLALDYMLLSKRMISHT